MSAGADLVGVDNVWIGGQEFRPTSAAAEVFFGQLPERIAGLDADGFLCRGPGVHRLDENTRGRVVGGNFGERRGDPRDMSRKCRANISTKVRTNKRTHVWEDPFTNFGMNTNVWTNGNGGERIATENI